MIVRAWRITRAKTASAAFSGDGAKKWGARWNSVGTPIVYASGTLAAAMLELVVHVDRHELLGRYVGFEVQFCDALVTSIDPTQLPANWKRSPPPQELQRLGDDWAASSISPVLRVPSVVVPGESNYLINPKHADMSKIEIYAPQPLRFDVRLART